jgi:hypothetical protein
MAKLPDSDEQFPRGTRLPSQSPLFWVEQKDRYIRQILIRDIEADTNRRLIVYYGNRYAAAQIDARDPLYFAELLDDIGDEPVDLLLETAGGFTDAAEALVSLLQSRVKDLRVIVANAAKSNGTLLCLAAQCIVMGGTSELGPIEPLIQNVPCSVLETPEIKAQNFPLHMAGIFALKQTRTLAKSLLENGMMKDEPPDKIEETVQKMSSRDSYYSHGSVINFEEAKALGLAVEYLDPKNDAWRRLWLLYCMYDHDARKSRLLKIFEGRKLSTAVAIPPAPAV